MEGSCLRIVPILLKGPPLERAERGIRNGVCDPVVRPGPAALGPHEIIFPVLLHHERPLDVALRGDGLIGLAVLKRHDAQQVIAEPDHVAVAPAAVIHIICTVIIPEHELVDRLGPVYYLADKRLARLGPVYYLADKRLAKCVPVRPFRRVGHSHADSAHLVIVLYVVGAEEQIVLPVGMDYRRSPHGFLCPADILFLQDGRVLLPGNQVFRGEGIEMVLLLIKVGIGRENPAFVAVDNRFRVSIPTFEHGISARFPSLRTARGNPQSQCSKQ